MKFGQLKEYLGHLHVNFTTSIDRVVLKTCSKEHLYVNSTLLI